MFISVMLLLPVLMSKSKHTRCSDLKYSGLRLPVPIIWVLTISLTLALARASACALAPQLRSPDPSEIHVKVNIDVIKDISDNPVHLRTTSEWSCDFAIMMPYLSKDQKQVLSSLYKNGRKLVKTDSHIEFLTNVLKKRLFLKGLR